MAKKVNIINVAEENGIFTATYETGSVKKYAADKLPKTVQKWIEEHQEPETEPETTTTEEPETMTELATTDEKEERKEDGLKKNSGNYERALLKIRKEREKRDIFRNLETIGLMVLGVGYLITAAIITALAAAVVWIAEHIPAMVKATRQAATKAAAAISTVTEVAEDTVKAFYHVGRKTATVAAAVMTMVTR